MSAICGLVGAWAAPQKGERNAGLMLDLLQPRGPDRAAVGRAPGGEAHAQVVLGVRQLKVRPDEPDTQVVIDAEAQQALVCDGRVFNKADVRAFIEGKGKTLRTRDDAELFLRLLQIEGLPGLRRVDGQFGLAFWDGRRNELTLARDFLGVRAVYYHVGSQGIAFASEIKALLAVPEVPVAADAVAASHYLTFLTVPGPRTLFEGIRKVPAGNAVIYGPGGSLRTEEFWSLLNDAVPERDDEAFYVDTVKRLHDEAVAGRMEEGPIAALVSGGNDSSANAVLMSRKMANPEQLHTFTVGLADLEGTDKYNDLVYAKQVANLIKSQHHERLMSVDEFLKTIPVTINAMDDLVSEPSAIFLHQALAMAKEQGMKMVVTGEANDELSCGHGEMIRIRERYYKRWLPYSRLPGVVKKLAAHLVPHFDPKRADLLQRAAAEEEYFWNYEIAWPESAMNDILTPDALRASSVEKAYSFVARDAARLRSSAHGNRDYLNHIIYRMMQDYYFGNLMLGKLDLLSGQLGLESRCPYTSPAYAHFVYNIPAKFKQRGGMVKYFFKRAIEGILPNEIIYRPKQGFRTPVVELFQNQLGDWARPILLEEGFTRTGVLRQDTVRKLLDGHKAGVADYSNKLWTVMVLNLWHKRWIGEGKPKATGESSARLPA